MTEDIKCSILAFVRGSGYTEIFPIFFSICNKRSQVIKILFLIAKTFRCLENIEFLRIQSLCNTFPEIPKNSKLTHSQLICVVGKF